MVERVAEGKAISLGLLFCLFSNRYLEVGNKAWAGAENELHSVPAKRHGHFRRDLAMRFSFVEQVGVLWFHSSSRWTLLYTTLAKDDSLMSLSGKGLISRNHFRFVLGSRVEGLIYIVGKPI